jgi:hypothetical protein
MWAIPPDFRSFAVNEDTRAAISCVMVVLRLVA